MVRKYACEAMSDRKTYEIRLHPFIDKRMQLSKQESNSRNHALVMTISACPTSASILNSSKASARVTP